MGAFEGEGSAPLVVEALPRPVRKSRRLVALSAVLRVFPDQPSAVRVCMAVGTAIPGVGEAQRGRGGVASAVAGLAGGVAVGAPEREVGARVQIHSEARGEEGVIGMTYCAARTGKGARLELAVVGIVMTGLAAAPAAAGVAHGEARSGSEGLLMASVALELSVWHVEVEASGHVLCRLQPRFRELELPFVVAGAAGLLQEQALEVRHAGHELLSMGRGVAGDAPARRSGPGRVGQGHDRARGARGVALLAGDPRMGPGEGEVGGVLEARDGREGELLAVAAGAVVAVVPPMGILMAADASLGGVPEAQLTPAWPLGEGDRVAVFAAEVVVGALQAEFNVPVLEGAHVGHAGESEGELSDQGELRPVVLHVAGAAVLSTLELHGPVEASSPGEILLDIIVACAARAPHGGLASGVAGLAARRAAELGQTLVHGGQRAW